MRTLEICAGDLPSALAAAQGGAQRIELCSALQLDGLTPSTETIETARRIEGLKLHVLIRAKAILSMTKLRPKRCSATSTLPTDSVPMA